VTITQYSAKQYTKWLSKLSGYQYRLPTEAEWEYACRAGSTSPWYWGDSPTEIDNYAWYFKNSEAGPGKVGQKKPNAFGLYDMLGNAAEWCVDHYTTDGYAAQAGKKLGAIEAGKFGGPPYPRVVRGGSWEMEPSEVRSASRLGSEDEDWKSEDPNIPLSPWWYTSDPARGVGFRLFRSYKALPPELISKFWEIDSEDIRSDVQARIEEGRGAQGIVDPSLPEVVKGLQE
jgi:formylglycine-generating enzyme